MRDLILLRHAHADAADAGQPDLDRPLSATGREEARAAGDWLREHGLLPDRVLCSPSARTRQTLAALGDIGGAPATLEPAIYEASPGTLAALVDAQRDAECLLLVGHNPGLEDLLEHLCAAPPPRNDAGKLLTAGALAQLTLQQPWSRLAPNGAGLVTLVRPRELEKQD